MEELKLLVESIAGLPDLAIWVVAMYFGFKLAVVGSIYGVVRFVTQRLHDILVSRKTTIKEIKMNLGGWCITSDSTPESMKRLLNKIKSTSYIHESDVKWALNALEYYEEAEGRSRYNLKKYNREK